MGFGDLAFGRDDPEAAVVSAFVWRGRGRSARPADRAACRRCRRDLPGASRRPGGGGGMTDGERPEFVRKTMTSGDTVRRPALD
jgi:hypothetical protein